MPPLTPLKLNWVECVCGSVTKTFIFTISEYNRERERANVLAQTDSRPIYTLHIEAPAVLFTDLCLYRHYTHTHIYLYLDLYKERDGYKQLATKLILGC